MTYKVKYSTSTLNVGGVLVEVFVQDWAQYRLIGKDLEEFTEDLNILEKFIEDKLTDKSFNIIQMYENDRPVTIVESQNSIEVPPILSKWLKRMQEDSAIVTFRNIESV
jgi:hypothetical protein